MEISCAAIRELDIDNILIRNHPEDTSVRTTLGEQTIPDGSSTSGSIASPSSW